MRRFSFRLTLITLAAGALGAVLRHFELRTAFEADTGLAKPGAPLTIILILFVLLYAVFLYLGVRRLRGLCPPACYEKAFGFRSGGKLAAQIVSVLVLFGAALACFFLAKDPVTGATKVEVVVVGLLAAVSGICFILLSTAAYRGEDRGGLAFSALAPVVFYCFLLTVLYKNRAADPVVLDYMYELFAVCAALLGLFFAAGSACGRPRPKRTVFFSHLGLFFSLLTLADGHELWMTGIFVFTALWSLFSCYSFVKNLQKPRPPEEGAIPAAADPEAAAEDAPENDAQAPSSDEAEIHTETFWPDEAEITSEEDK